MKTNKRINTSEELEKIDYVSQELAKAMIKNDVLFKLDKEIAPLIIERVREIAKTKVFDEIIIKNLPQSVKWHIDFDDYLSDDDDAWRECESLLKKRMFEMMAKSLRKIK